MHNSATINLNTLELGVQAGVKRFFYSSSACIYPEYNQRDPQNPKCSEESAYPAAPDSEYGWEKLFSERLYFAYARNRGVAGAGGAIPQCFRTAGHVVGRPRKGAGGGVPQSGGGSRTAARSRSGATDCRRVRSFIWMSAWKRCAG